MHYTALNVRLQASPRPPHRPRLVSPDQLAAPSLQQGAG
jgi:hypothetical protein